MSTFQVKSELIFILKIYCLLQPQILSPIIRKPERIYFVGCQRFSSSRNWVSKTDNIPVYKMLLGYESEKKGDRFIKA